MSCRVRPYDLYQRVAAYKYTAPLTATNNVANRDFPCVIGYLRQYWIVPVYAQEA